MNFMPEMLNERKAKLATTAILNAISDAAGDEAEGLRILIGASRTDRDIADGLAMIAYRQFAASMGGDRDGVEVGLSKRAEKAADGLPASTPTNSGAEGRGGHVSPGDQMNLAPAPLPEREEEGHASVAQSRASTEVPSSSPPLHKNTGGVGQKAPALTCHASAARPPVPIRKPSSIELLAARKVENAAANSIFKTFMVRGRAIGSYTFGELKHTEYQGLIEAAVCRRIRRYAPMTYGRALISAILTEKQLKKFIDDATKEVEDAAA